MILFIAALTIAGTIMYLHFITAFFKEEVVYHWLAWTLSMFAASTFVFEPFLIFFVEVIWCATVQYCALTATLGPNALANTNRYDELVKQVKDHFVTDLRRQAAERIQTWWLAVLDMYRAVNEQTAAAIKIQATRKAMISQKKYIKERKWCMRVEVVGVTDLDWVELDGVMSPQVRLLCDAGNPQEMITTPKWERGQRADIGETFLVDIKESNALYATVWTVGIERDEFIGRGYFELGGLKNMDEQPVDGHKFFVNIYKMQHGESEPRNQNPRGKVHLRVQFLDPLRDSTGPPGPDEFAWMLPKNRMQFALSKMGGKARVGKMLGRLHQAHAAAAGADVPGSMPVPPTS
jgi:hypothetical protein